MVTETVAVGQGVVLVTDDDGPDYFLVRRGDDVEVHLQYPDGEFVRQYGRGRGLTMVSYGEVPSIM